MPTLLVIDDDASIQHAVRRFFHEPDYTLLTASSGAEGLRLGAEHRPDVIILDLALPDMSGMQAFRRLHKEDARVPVVFITGHGTAQGAIEAMKEGAHDYLFKPVGLNQMREVVTAALQVSRLMRMPVVLSGEAQAEESDILIGHSSVMREIYKAISRVAPQDLTVLIQGESGTGKELVARAIFQNSCRGDKPFLAINCAAIPEALLESELFGHEKGAFTGADRQRIGKFQQANGGTLFLDEIGDMTPLTQAKMLRVLQDHRFDRVGGNESILSDVRIITATNRKLKKLVEDGHFRADLFFRLSVFAIDLPPLRERIEDLPLLLDHFLKRFAQELGKQVDQAAPEVLELLARHPWPGNIRELQSVLRQAMLQAWGPILLPQHLPAALRGGEESVPAAPESPLATYPGLDRFMDDYLQSGRCRLYDDYQGETERYLFSRVMRHTRGNQLQAAGLLGIARGKLRSKLRALGLSTERGNWIDSDQPPPPTGSGDVS